MIGISNFQKKVYDALLLIPKGYVITYKILAEYLGIKSAQAIGQALKRNPFAPKIPCHRVIKSDFSIGGYKGSIKSPQLSEKEELLKSEGVEFVGGILKDKRLVFYY